MPTVTVASAAKMLGRKRMSQVDRLWCEGSGIQVVLKPGLINSTYETDGRFVPFEHDTLADFRDDLLEFFDDVVKE